MFCWAASAFDYESMGQPQTRPEEHLGVIILPNDNEWLYFQWCARLLLLFFFCLFVIGGTVGLSVSPANYQNKVWLLPLLSSVLLPLI
jgi:hypothetical protein